MKYLTTALLLALAGCVAPIGNDTPIASPEVNQAAANQPVAQNTQLAALYSNLKPMATSVGTQSGEGGWTINVGSLELGGSTMVVLAIVLAIIVLARRGNTFKATTDVLVGKIEKMKLDKVGRLDIATKANTAGVGKALAKRVKAVRAKTPAVEC
jgi:hypothetical protein